MDFWNSDVALGAASLAGERYTVAQTRYYPNIMHVTAHSFSAERQKEE